MPFRLARRRRGAGFPLSSPAHSTPVFSSSYANPVRMGVPLPPTQPAECVSLRLHWAVEGEVKAIGVGDGEALHVIGGNKRLLQHGDAEGKKFVEGGVRIGAAEVERGVAMRGDAGGVRRGRALAFVIRGVEHKSDAFAAQHAPVKVVALGALHDRGVADKLEAQHLAIEIHGCGHIKNL